jgi:hypothetical protein
MTIKILKCPLSLKTYDKIAQILVYRKFFIYADYNKIIFHPKKLFPLFQFFFKFLTQKKRLNVLLIPKALSYLLP